ncbi:MAG: ROK family protein, partial [Acidimicrobiales bacterium]
MGASANLVLALDIGGTKLTAGIGDTSGHLRGQRTEPTDPLRGAADVLRRAIDLARSVLQEERLAEHNVSALGVSTMGLTRPHEVLLAPNVPGWDALTIPLSLEAAFPTMAVSVANDVKAATLAEARWGGLAGVTSGVYLNLGTGIAAGIVVGGKVLEGAHGSAGEVGYTLVEGWRGVRLAADGGVPAEEILGGRGVAVRASEL